MCLALVGSSFGSPLVFKTEKTINSKDFVELGSFDAGKYKSIRVLVANKSYKTSVPIEYLEAALKAAKLEAERSKSDRYSPAEKDRAAERLLKAQTEYDSANKIDAGIILFSIDGADKFVLDEYFNKSINRSLIIERPPSKIRVYVKGTGNFKLFVWGS